MIVLVVRRRRRVAASEQAVNLTPAEETRLSALLREDG
jgi:hypothetical protein